MIHVAYCFDKNYRQHFGAAVTSLLHNGVSANEQLTVHVVSDSIDEKFATQLEALRAAHAVEINFYKLGTAMLEEIADVPHHMLRSTQLTKAIYYRCYLAALLPSDVGKVLYLDSDTIVLKGIGSLYHRSMDGSTVAGALDLNSESLGRNLDTPHYINSGVLLINLDRWRAEQVTARCIGWVAANPSLARLGDQCAINAVLKDQLQLIEPHWNCYVRLPTGKMSVASPSILHFIGLAKPWKAWTAGRLSDYYWHYIALSPWRNATPDKAQTIREAYLLAKLYERQQRYPEALAIMEELLKIQNKQLVAQSNKD